MADDSERPEFVEYYNQMLKAMAYHVILGMDEPQTDSPLEAKKFQEQASCNCKQVIAKSPNQYRLIGVIATLANVMSARHN